MTIHCGGFAVLTTAWMLLISSSVIGVLLIKKLGRP